MRDLANSQIALKVWAIKNRQRKRSLCRICISRPPPNRRFNRTAGQTGPPKPCQHKTGSLSIFLYFSQLTFRQKVLESWRSKRYIDPQKIDEVLTSLDSRPTIASPEEPTSNKTTPKFASSPQQALPRGEVNKRIEQDRERHKRLRERRWVQPTSHNPATFQPPQLATFYPLTEPGDGQEELALDIEFENEWETTSDWNEDDEEAIGEEAELAFPSDDEKPNVRTSKISWHFSHCFSCRAPLSSFRHFEPNFVL